MPVPIENEDILAAIQNMGETWGEIIRKHEEALYGNGRAGLFTRFALMEVKMKWVLAGVGTALTAGISAAAAQLFGG